jgi:histidine ammonia-lyase
MELVRYAELACALSMEAMRAVRDALDDRIHAARNHPGQRASAEMLRSLLEGSQWVEEEARRIRFPYERPTEHGQRCRVQDAYSLRCAPQVHGAARDVLDFVRVVLERELNAATDNPLVVPARRLPGAQSTEARAAYEVLSGGNFHGEIIAFAMDFLAVAVHELGSISERRSARFLDPTMSHGLPPNLVGTEPGLNTGFAVVQCVASSLVAENRTLCTPASIDSIPTKGNQEDHVSMATWAARKARRVVENCRAILAVEILCACQGISLAQAYLGGLSLGRGTGAAYRALRRRVPATTDDRYMNEQLSEVIRMMQEGSLLEGVQ